MKSNLGTFDLDVPRDREGSFEAQIVQKHQTDVYHLEKSIIGMYARGMTTIYILKLMKFMVWMYYHHLYLT